jgi:AcrR family transcriptional regulator
MRFMRTKDEQKKEALFEATIKLVNDIGFASSSVSKIAKEAGVSPSTIYVFYKNKEDLLVSTYIELKRKMSDALLDNFDVNLPIRDIIRNVWFGMFKYISINLGYYDYMEQFANSPYNSLVDKAALEKHFIPIIEVVERGIQQKIIKNVDLNLLSAFLFHPVSRLANPRLCHGWELDEEALETAFTMAWDAIKL